MGKPHVDMSKHGSIVSKEITLREYPEPGKYQSCYRKGAGKDSVFYVTIWYRGDEIYPEMTYTRAYCEKHKLGEFAEKKTKKPSGKSASKQTKTSSTDSATDARKRETARKKAEYEAYERAKTIAENEEIDNHIKLLKKRYPLKDASVSELHKWLKELAAQTMDQGKGSLNDSSARVLEYQLDATGNYALKIARKIKKLDPAFYKEKDLESVTKEVKSALGNAVSRGIHGLRNSLNNASVEFHDWGDSTYEKMEEWADGIQRDADWAVRRANARVFGPMRRSIKKQGRSMQSSLTGFFNRLAHPIIALQEQFNKLCDKVDKQPNIFDRLCDKFDRLCDKIDKW